MEDIAKSFDRLDPPRLKNIALGCLTWSDVWLGNDYHRGQQELHDFLQLQVYDIHYEYKSKSIYSPVLKLVSQGSPRDIEDSHRTLSILKPYWLG